MYLEWILLGLALLTGSLVLLGKVKNMPEGRSTLVDYGRSLFPVILIVFVLRSFIAEPFQIPSSSMVPTLQVGDYILVNKYTYGIRLPVVRTKVVDLNEPERGDVMVFFPPHMNDTYYIKRVIGLPGDSVELRNGALFLNGIYRPEPYVEEAYRLGDSVQGRNFGPTRVKPGHYFVMGDHRDASSDSRDWGQVDQKLLKGRALLIWYSYEEEPNSHKLSAGGQVRSWGSKFIHFFTKSRFSRCFTLIR